jgi:TolB protein
MKRSFRLPLFALLACVTLRAADPVPPAADVLFSSTREGNAEVYVLSAATGAITNLTRHPDGDNWPAWSPDGARIAFQRRHEGKFDLWVMNTDGSEPRRLTDHPDHDYLPAWTADGTALIFTSWRTEPGDTERQPHLYVMQADGSGQRRLPLRSLATSSGADCSRDGSRIVYARQISERDAVIFSARPDGTDERQLTQPDGGYHGAPSWSPDGRLIAFYHDNGAGKSAIELMNADGTGRRVILPGGQHWYPHWSPDGRWLLLTSMHVTEKGNVELYAVKADGSGGLLPLAASPHREAEGSWRPGPGGK